MEQIYRRKRVDVTVREEVLQAAKALDINVSRAAETGIRNAVREARVDQWLAANCGAVRRNAGDVEDPGPALPAIWAKP